jgi:hypothetical protein
LYFERLVFDVRFHIREVIVLIPVSIRKNKNVKRSNKIKSVIIF